MIRNSIYSVVLFFTVQLQFPDEKYTYTFSVGCYVSAELPFIQLDLCEKTPNCKLRFISNMK